MRGSRELGSLGEWGSQGGGWSRGCQGTGQVAGSGGERRGEAERRGRLTFPQLPLPHGDDGPRVFAVVDEPQGQGLHALLRVAQLRQLLLQRRLREGGHPSDTALTPSHAVGLKGRRVSPPSPRPRPLTPPFPTPSPPLPPHPRSAANQQDGVQPAVTSRPTHAPPTEQAQPRPSGRGGEETRAGEAVGGRAPGSGPEAGRGLPGLGPSSWEKLSLPRGN